jgi:hypothetical protein
VRHGLLVTNMTSRAAGIDTSGGPIADVVNPRTGAVIGGYSGPVRMMLQALNAAAGQTARVPLLVATDSFLPDLGYAIPPETGACRQSWTRRSDKPGGPPSCRSRSSRNDHKARGTPDSGIAHRTPDDQQ